MPISRALVAVLLCGAAARAQEIRPVMDRPITLPKGNVDLTLHGTYTNWGNSSAAGGGSGSLAGESLAVGADFGATDDVQLGLALALPINPGAGFGSVVGSADLAVTDRIALRADMGFESIGLNGNGTAGSSHTSRYFGGIGASFRVPITPAVAFVTGRTGAVQFGHFNNIGDAGTGLYTGASAFTEASSDFLVLSGGNNGSATIIGINLPAGLLIQLDPRVAVTLQTGYSTAISTAGNTQSLHFIPIGLEAVVTPAPRLDIGGRFFIDGLVATTGGGTGNPQYLDLRVLMLYFRIHA